MHQILHLLFELVELMLLVELALVVWAMDFVFKSFMGMVYPG